MIVAAILFLLVTDVLSNGRFVATDRRNEIPPGPKMRTYEVALGYAVNHGEMDCALALDITGNLRHPIFLWDRDHHVNVTGRQKPFFDPAFILRRQLKKHFAQAAAKFDIKRLPPALRDEGDVIFAVPFRVA